MSDRHGEEGNPMAQTAGSHHGTSAYTNHGCRCEVCRAAKAASATASRAAQGRRRETDSIVLSALAAACAVERGGWASASEVSARTGLSTQATLARLARDGYAEVWTPRGSVHLYRVRTSEGVG